MSGPRRIPGASARRARVAVIGALVTVAAGTALATTPPAGAATEGACPTSDGVTVVVDFASLGGGVVVRCAPGAPGTGFDALRAAGFAVTTTRDPGFLCRIDDRPAADREPCVDTPPPDAYWSYWYAPRGGQWNYSNVGGASRSPIQGTVEGWRFSDGTEREPGIESPAAAAVIPPTTASPRPTAPPTRPAGTAPPVAAAPPAGAAPGTPTTGASGTVPPSTATAPAAGGTAAEHAPGTGEVAAAADASVLGTTATAGGARGPRTAGARARDLAEATMAGGASAVDAAPPVVVLSDGSGVVGSPAGTAVGVAVVATVGVGAGATHRRRRRTPAAGAGATGAGAHGVRGSGG